MVFEEKPMGCFVKKTLKAVSSGVFVFVTWSIILRRLLCAMALMVLVSEAALADSYYAVFFANDHGRILLFSRMGHQFASFVRVADDGVALEQFTVSWLPLHLPIRPFAGEEEGRNVSLAESINLSLSNGMTIYQLGPFKISEDLWRAAEIQYFKLENSGSVSYSCLLTPNRLRSFNCVEAILDIAPYQKWIRARTARYYGVNGIRAAVSHLQSGFSMVPVTDQATFDLISIALGISNIPRQILRF